MTLSGHSAVPRRAFLAGAGALVATGAATQLRGDGAVMLDAYARSGDPDDTLALKRAIETGRPVHARAGRGRGPGGGYAVGMGENDNLPAGLRLSGDGAGKTVFLRSPVSAAPFILHCDSKSADPARNIAGLAFADLSFEDDVARLGFSEYQYLVMLNGVTAARFDRVTFRGFRGDGLHLGSSTVSHVERHNRDVAVADCRFDGVNSNNRNAISVIDCDGLTVERCAFVNCSRPGDGGASAADPMNPATGPAMPGPIDLEPNDDAFAVIRRIAIRDNRFTGGGGSAVALHLLPNDRVRSAQSGIEISRNIVEDRAGAFEVTGHGGAGALGKAPGYGIVLRGNQVRRCGRPFALSGAKGVLLDDNLFADCTDRAEIGHTAEVADVELRGNRFERIGANTMRFGLWIRGSRGVTLDGNIFADVGGPDKKGGIAIALVGGVTRGLTLARNRFTRPGGRTSEAITVFRDARVDRATLKLDGNVVDFPAPPIAGALSGS